MLEILIALLPAFEERAGEVVAPNKNAKARAAHDIRAEAVRAAAQYTDMFLQESRSAGRELPNSRLHVVSMEDSADD